MDFGEWGDVVRALADYQVDKYHQVFRWPIGEALAAYEARLKQDAQKAYMVEFIGWNIRAQAGSKEKPPQLPEILRP